MTKHQKDEVELPEANSENEKNDLNSIESGIESKVTSSDEPKKEDKLPEGGYGWVISFAGSFVLFTTFGQVNSYGVFQSYYTNTMFPGNQYSAATIALIGGIQAFFLFGFGIFAGKATGFFGSRVLSIVGSIILVFSMFMIGLCKELWQLFITQGLLLGFGGSILYYSWSVIPSQYFKEKRSFSLAIVATGSGVGAICWPILYHNLFDKVGFRNTMFIAAGVAGFLLTISNLLLRLRFPWKMPDRLVDLSAFKEIPFIFLCLGYVILFFGFYVPYVFIELFMQYKGVKGDITFYIISIMAAGSATGRLLPGFLADYVGRFNTLIVGTFGSGIIVFALWFSADGLSSIIAFAVLYGFFSGICVAMIAPTVAQISKIHDIPLRTGLMQSFIAIPSIAGPPLAGEILGDNNDYNGIIAFSGTTLFVSGMLIVVARFFFEQKTD